jgi:hypothetical protein
LGEVLTPAFAEGIARGGESLPQRVVRATVDAANRLPLLDDGPQPIAGNLPGS